VLAADLLPIQVLVFVMGDSKQEPHFKQVALASFTNCEHLLVFNLDYTVGVYFVFRDIKVNCISFSSYTPIYLTRDANDTHRRRALLSASGAVRDLEFILGLFEHIHFSFRHHHHYELLALKVSVANSLDEVVHLAPRSSGDVCYLRTLLPSVGSPEANSVVNRG